MGFERKKRDYNEFGIKSQRGSSGTSRGNTSFNALNSWCIDVGS